MSMGDLLEGASYPVRALAVLWRTPGLWRYVVVPVLLNVVVGIVVYVGLLVPGLRAIDGLLVGLPGWAAALAAGLRVVLAVGLLLATGFVLTRFGVVLGSPWYGVLSGRLEAVRAGVAPPGGSGGLGGALGDLGRAVRYEARKLLLVLTVSAFLLPVNLVPGVGAAAAGLGAIALGATVACLDFLDAPLERRSLTFGQKLGVVRRSLPASAGFGLVCFALAGIPLLSLFAVPLCVAAGTLFFCDRIAGPLPSAHSNAPAPPALR